MQIVINIPERVYEDFTKVHGIGYVTKNNIRTMENALLNGIILPEGHGQIGDLNKLIRAMKERNDDNGGEPLNAVDRGYNLAYQHMVEEAKGCVIIEAESKVEE